MLPSEIASISMTSISFQRSLAPSTVLLRQVGTLPRRPRPHQQIRMFRIGLWSSYLDANFQKEVRRRHRMMKYRYIAALNRNLSWDRHSPTHPKHHGLKGFMCSAWRGQDTRPGGRWVDMDRLENIQGKSQNSSDKGIEDVEQSALEKLLGHRDGVYDFIRARSKLWGHPMGSVAFMSERPTNFSSSSTPSSVYGHEGFRRRFQSALDSDPQEESEYEIDPITNRKVYKNKSSGSSEASRKAIDIPVKTFRAYRSESHMGQRFYAAFS